MAVLLSCPGCSRQMTIPDESRGVTVRCPACNTLFASVRDPYNNPLPSGAVQTQVPPSPLLGPGYVEVTPTRTDYATSSAPPPSSGREPRWDEDPLSMQRKPDPLTTFVLLGGLAMLAVILLVFTAFIWPGFLRREEGFAQQGRHDLLSLAPADAVLLGGLTLDDGNLNDKLRELLLQQPDMPPVLKDLLADAQRVVLAGGVSNEAPTGIAALLTKTPYDREKIKAGLRLGQEHKVGGAVIFTTKLPDLFADADVHIAMPDPRVLVVGVMPEAEFVKALANQGKAPVVQADIIARVRELETGTAWLLLANRGAVKEKLKAVLANPLLPFVKEPSDIVLRSKSLSLAVRPLDKDFHVALGLECSNRADAIRMHKIVDDAWKQEANKDQADPVLRDLTQTFKLELEGTKLIGSAEISEKALMDLGKAKLPAKR